MGYKSYPTAKWLKWLQFRGLERKRSKGSHFVWDHPAHPYDRPIVVREAEKDVPGCHIHTTLKTMNVKYQDFQNEIEGL